MTAGPSIKGSGNWLARRKVVNVLMLGLSGFGALIAISTLLSVLLYLLINGVHYINWHVLAASAAAEGDSSGGLKNAIVGSLVLIGIASTMGLPIGILGGIFQIESKGKFANTVRFLTDVLNSVPSIVIGLFIYILVVVPTAARHFGQGYSALAGGIALAVIMIPTIMRTTEEILRMVPTSLSEGSLALGASQWRTMLSIILPAARAGIITGIMLALARIAGETAPLLFTALGNAYFNVDIHKPIDSLPLAIYTGVTGPDDFLHNQAFAGALILIVLILTLSSITRLAASNKLLEEK